MITERKSKVCYFYDENVASYYYGGGHPMKPHRLRMTHNLLLAYGLYKKMEVYRPHPAQAQEMVQFHSKDYVDFLQRVTPDNAKEFLHQLQKFNLGPYTDCPVFEGLFEFCQLYTGGSIDGAMKLNHGLTDVAVNWSGGLHHAKKSEASGFCYVNDIVLAILELLKYHARVLYIDIDIHHGDGVEEAFYTTDRVMTVSFHKFGDFFPGSGDLKDDGAGKGKKYSINFPLNDGIDDKSYLAVFKPVIQKVMEMYRPGAVVLQCGADSLTGDRLGCFNLTLKGHGDCVKFVKGFNLPTLVLGGGGYNIRNVSRCWTYETAVLLDHPISNNIPYNDFFHYYGPDFKLHLMPSDMSNMNSREDLEKTKQQVLINLGSLDHAPSVQMQQVPPDLYSMEDTDEGNPDVRISQKEYDKMVQREDEWYDEDKDQDQRRLLPMGGAGSAQRRTKSPPRPTSALSAQAAQAARPSPRPLAAAGTPTSARPPSAAAVPLPAASSSANAIDSAALPAARVSPGKSDKSSELSAESAHSIREAVMAMTDSAAAAGAAGGASPVAEPERAETTAPTSAAKNESLSLSMDQSAE